MAVNDSVIFLKLIVTESLKQQCDINRDAASLLIHRLAENNSDAIDVQDIFEFMGCNNVVIL